MFSLNQFGQFSLESTLSYLKTNNHLYQNVVINTENISLDDSACISYDNFHNSKQIHEVISNYKSLSSEIFLIIRVYLVKY